MNTNHIGDRINILGVIFVLPLWLITYSIYGILLVIKYIKK
jgi:hypothetical protein